MVDSEEDVPEKAAATNEISQANHDCATQKRSLGPVEVECKVEGAQR